MAEGLLRYYAGKEYEALSAGTSAPGEKMLPILCISEEGVCLCGAWLQGHEQFSNGIIGGRARGG